MHVCVHVYVSACVCVCLCVCVCVCVCVCWVLAFPATPARLFGPALERACACTRMPRLHVCHGHRLFPRSPTAPRCFIRCMLQCTVQFMSSPCDGTGCRFIVTRRFTASRQLARPLTSTATERSPARCEQKVCACVRACVRVCVRACVRA